MSGHSPRFSFMPPLFSTGTVFSRIENALFPYLNAPIVMPDAICL